MGASRLIPLVVKFETTGFGMTPMAWPGQHLGKPTEKKLVKFLEDLWSSFQPGGANDTVLQGFPDAKITGAKVIKQKDGTVVASWKYQPAAPAPFIPDGLTDAEYSLWTD